MWALITHNRPAQCAAVLEQIKKVGCSTRGFVVVNGDCSYGDADLKHLLPEGWDIEYMGSNFGLCGAMNHVYKKYPGELFYGLICDDEFVYTPGWDTRLAEAAGNWNISHGNDGWQSKTRLHTYCTVGGDLVRECGWWALPGLWHWFHDDVQELLARELGLKRHCEDVSTEHKHYLAGKAVKDNTYALGESRAQADQQVFEKWVKSGEALALIGRVRKKMGQGICFSGHDTVECQGINQ